MASDVKDDQMARESLEPPRDTLLQIFRIWNDVAGDGRTRHGFYGGCLGILTAAKLMLRLREGGPLQFSGDRRVLDFVESKADEFGDNVIGTMRDVFPPEIRIRRMSEHPHLRLCRGQTDFHWSRKRIAKGNDQLPIRATLLAGTEKIAHEVCARIIDHLADTRAKARADGQLQQQTLAHWIALSGTAKMMLALFDDDDVSASLEHLAEVASGKEFEQMRRASG